MNTHAHGMRKIYVLLTALALFATMFAVAPAQGQETSELTVPDDAVDGIVSEKAESVYIVMFEDDPVATYDGDIAGFPATRPGDGKLNPNSARVKKYQKFLTDKHEAALADAGVDSKIYSYTISFNGVAAKMTGIEATALAKQDGVLTVWKDEIRELHTDRSPDYLDLPAIWEGVGGVEQAGEDVIIGVIDTGIDPDSPSFSDQADNVVLTGKGSGNAKKNDVYGPPPSYWNGTCQSGERWSQNDCNNKLIGARYFNDGFSNHDIHISGDWLSARDANGHGTHTASTAGGNVVETAYPTGEPTTITGMAPRARIAAYKGCWEAGCAVSDLVAAIDQAVADGVDVINYSIGSAAQTVTGPDDIAFLVAADAGVFVATSNGNDGPGANTTGSPSSSPWLISVGAVDHGRNFLGSVTLGDNTTFTGASLNETVVSGPLVDSEDLGNPLCELDEEFSEDITGKIVLCERGLIARVDKSAAVAAAGGIGMIMFNPTPNSLNADTHSVPSVHVDHNDGPDIKSYIDTAGADATATINEGGEVGIRNENVMAGFSSRGLGASEDIIKPDIIAPGVNVYAAVPEETTTGTNPNLAGFISGTSMASPHIAGIGALITQAHPEWSPAAIKSALMTTADPAGILKEDQTTPATPLDQGSGLVQPGSALSPGLVYDAGFFDYVAFLCGNSNIVAQDFCDDLEVAGFPFDGSDLNQPNIAIGSLAGFQTVERSVTATSAGEYSVNVDAPAGIEVEVSPTVLSLSAGETATYGVTFTSTEAADLGEFAFGSLTWSDGTHSVRSSLAIRPVRLAAPEEVFGTGQSASTSFDVTFGYAGTYTPEAHGLFPAERQEGNVVDDPANDINTALATGVGITQHVVTVPSGAAFARFSLFDDFTDGNDDLDLYVFGPQAEGFPFVGGSGSATSAEQVTLEGPDSGTYLVFVHGWQTDGPDANYTLFNWSVLSDPGADDGSLVIESAPSEANLGATGTVEVGWTGLDAAEKYLGAVSHADSGGVFGHTLVSVSTE